MGQLLLLLVVALTVAAVVFGVTVLVTGRDPGLVPVEPDGRAVPLPGGRPLAESDIGGVRFDTALRGYRMDQVDAALRRAAYDIGYKSELIGVLEAEVAALREGRTAEADELRDTRLASLAVAPASVDDALPAAAASAGAETPAADDPTRPATDAVTGEPGTAPEAETGPEAGAVAAGTTTTVVDDTEGAGGTGDAGTDRRPAGQPDIAVRSESA
ncbi:DivIVA domain-containing protein [Micromonospora echinospora]|uniref:DivIVA domain-containing protein n=1 Tax=Micromonospora echinospora TaxID=1877 RepID=UPI00366D54D6